MSQSLALLWFSFSLIDLLKKRKEENCCFCWVYYLSQMGFNWVSGFYSFTSLLSNFFCSLVFCFLFWSKGHTNWPTWLLNYIVSHFIDEFSTFLSLLTLFVSQIKSYKMRDFSSRRYKITIAISFEACVLGIKL